MIKTLLTASIVLFLTTWTCADQTEPTSIPARMPVKEITVFKDGHAFVLHQGTMPTDASGNVVIDCMPAPVLGTFWPYSADKNAKLMAVTSGQRKVTVERTALALTEMIEANIGANVIVTESGMSYPAEILGLPVRNSEELAKTSLPNAGEMPPQKGSFVLFKTQSGVKVVNIAQIHDITIKGEPRSKIQQHEFRNMLTLKMDWEGKSPQKTADVGMIYLQRGVRWIPNYKITLDGKGSAVVKLQATLLNELTDMEDVTCNLVVGVPTFAFKDTVDPIALQTAVAQLSQYFKEDAKTAQGFSNAIMTQTARMTEVRPSTSGTAPMDLGPEVGNAERAEDLFVFTVKHVTLKKGQRMVFPITEYTLSYKDVYVLDIPFAPPSDVFRNFNSQQQVELARLLAAPKVMHRIRLINKSIYPLTTAPALILRGERLLAQGMMTYTAIGGSTDLAITAAVDIQVKKLDKETKRTPNADVWQGDRYARIDLVGAISLTNFRKEAVELEIVRHVLGNVTEAGQDGKVGMVNVLEDATFGRVENYAYPSWWSWHNWPHWWTHFNGIGSVTWKKTLVAGKSEDLTYEWHYYWR